MASAQRALRQDKEAKRNRKRWWVSPLPIKQAAVSLLNILHDKQEHTQGNQKLNSLSKQLWRCSLAKIQLVMILQRSSKIANSHLRTWTLEKRLGKKKATWLHKNQETVEVFKGECEIRESLVWLLALYEVEFGVRLLSFAFITSGIPWKLYENICNMGKFDFSWWDGLFSLNLEYPENVKIQFSRQWDFFFPCFFIWIKNFCTKYLKFQQQGKTGENLGPQKTIFFSDEFPL